MQEEANDIIKKMEKSKELSEKRKLKKNTRANKYIENWSYNKTKRKIDGNLKIPCYMEVFNNGGNMGNIN